MAHDPTAIVIDMTPDGGFAQPPRTRPQLDATGLKTTGLAIALTVIGTLVVSIVLVVWLAITLLPVLAAIALAAYLISRLKAGRWRFRGQLRRASFGRR